MELRDRYSYEAAAKHLGISPNSIKTHINRAYKVMNANNVKNAVKKAEAFGLLDLRKAYRVNIVVFGLNGNTKKAGEPPWFINTAKPN